MDRIPLLVFQLSLVNTEASHITKLKSPKRSKTVENVPRDRRPVRAGCRYVS